MDTLPIGRRLSPVPPIGAFAIVSGVLAGVVSLILVWMGPMAAVLGASVLVFGAFVIRFAGSLSDMFLTAVWLVLVGYLFFSRNFAYIGVAPVYIGELALALGLVAALASGRVWSIARLPQTWILIVVAIWGAARTVPFVSEYGIDALRDAVVWAYGAFALAVATCLIRTSGLESLLRKYGHVIPWFVLWVTVSFALRVLTDETPNDALGPLAMKMGDAGVHLAGAGAFALVVGFGDRANERSSILRSPRVFWVLWLAAVACVLSQSRGGFVSIVAALGVLTVLNPGPTLRRVVPALLVIALVSGIVVGMIDVSGRYLRTAETSSERTFTPSQILGNVISIFGGETDEALGGTRRWRLEWWSAIADYTVFGPYFWTGKGYGVNLADDDGFQGTLGDDLAPTRSPHNGHMTVLARSGVPGLVLWAILHLTFGAGLVRSYLRAARVGARRWAGVNLWLIGYWLAFLVNASFDVFLEGPQGGIWFWCVFGIGLAALWTQHALGADLGRRGVLAESG